MTVDKNSPEWKTGVVAENKVAAYLEWSGCMVARVGNAGDMAPMLRSWCKSLTLPDLQVTWPKTRQTCWVEVKWKSTTGHIRVMDITTTGVDRSKYEHYRAIERHTDKPVRIVFLQKAQDAVYLADLDSGIVPSLGAGKQMVCWDVSKLTRLCSYRAVWNMNPRAGGIDEPLFMPPPPKVRQVQLSLLDQMELDDHLKDIAREQWER